MTYIGYTYIYVLDIIGRYPYYIGMTLIKTEQTKVAIEKAYSAHEDKKALRSYFLPVYQQQIIDILHESTGSSKGAIVRAIIDDWLELSTGNGTQ